MGTLLLELAITYLEYSLGQEDEGDLMPALAFRQEVWNVLRNIRGPWRVPRTPRTPPTPLTIPPGPARPGVLVAIGLGGGAMVHKVGSFMWSHRWWLAAGVGAFLLGSHVINYLRRRLNDREQDTVPEGQAVALFCVEHLYLQVRNQVDSETEMSVLLQVSLERVRRMLLSNELHMVNSESYSISIQSRHGKTVGLIITGNLGKLKQWYCCSNNVLNPIEITRTLSELSYLASRRMTPSLQSLETITDGPEYIILAGDTIIDVLQNLPLLEFAYQGVRPGINIRDLCETLHQLSVPSASPSEILLLVIVQFKAPLHPITLQPDDIARRKGKAPMDSGEGTSGSKTE